MQDRQHVVIVGAGFSGSALALHLSGLGPAAPRVTLIEAGSRLGRGVAYGTDQGEHLLNTPAGRMSLFAHDPEHFLRWCRGRDRAVTAATFIERRLYGDYVEETLLAAAQAPGSSLTPLSQARVEDVEPAPLGFEVALERGQRLQANAVVLATGNPPPLDPLAASLPRASARYIRDPWGAIDWDAIAPDDRVLLIGTGLTMADVALTLGARGHRGRIDAVSRRGLVPRAHSVAAELLPRDLHAELERGVEHRRLRCALRAVRETITAAEARGFTWRAVLDSLRARTPELWAEMCPPDKQRFVERLRPYWDAHRHRLPPASAERIEALRSSGRLRVIAARLRGAVEHAEGFEVELAARGARSPARERYAWIVNCTGSSFDKRASRALERRLLARGLLIPDPLALGYLALDDGTAFGACGPTRGLYLLGPACRSQWWELTAVPELKQRASALADELARLRVVRAPAIAGAPQRL